MKRDFLNEPKPGFRIEQRMLRKCPECREPITAHDWRCSKLKTRYYPEKEQRKHAQLGTPWHAPFFEGEMSDLEWHFADRDDYFMEEGL